MISLKIKQWDDGKYCRILDLDSATIHEMEAYVLNKLMIEGRLPPNTFVAKVELQVECHVQGTLEEMKSTGEYWAKVYTLRAQAERKDVRVKSAEIKLENVEGPHPSHDWQPVDKAPEPNRRHCSRCRVWEDSSLGRMACPEQAEAVHYFNPLNPHGRTACGLANPHHTLRATALTQAVTCRECRHAIGESKRDQ